MAVPVFRRTLADERASCARASFETGYAAPTINLAGLTRNWPASRSYTEIGSRPGLARLLFGELLQESFLKS